MMKVPRSKAEPASSTNCELIASVKSDYAARAVLGLSRHFPTGQAVRVEHLAAEDGLPANYLVQILLELKAHGLVRSVRGKQGGYLLARPPSQITFGDVLRAVHGAVFTTPALGDPACPRELQRAWRTLQQAVEATSEAVTFQQLLDESAERGRMYYI
jgi:Rrf2 family transcriptional regulator, cysteine metabolism repressor